jgi:leucyl-tRNA synthetase
MFAAPPEQTLEWNDAGVEGAHRFLRRVWAFAARHADALREASDAPSARGAQARALRREAHGILRQIDYDYVRMQYNTVVSGTMKMLNALEKASSLGDENDGPAVQREAFGILLRVLYPACPHITHALWHEIGYARRFGELLDAPWPHVDQAALVQEQIELVLQVNGKLRGAIKVSADAGRHQIEVAALASPEFARFAEGKRAKKVIVVPGRLVNIVV